VGGLLHDIGKMRLPESLLRKAGRFTNHDIAVMQKHPELGLELLQNNCALADPGSTVVVHHHERFNGSGYPSRFRGPDISEITFVAGLADVYDAMTTDRPHRSAYLPQESLAIIFQGSDELFPRQLVEHFTKLLGIYPVGSFVRLESGEMGIVVHISPDHLLKPVVLLLFDSNGVRYAEPFECDLSAVSATPGVQIPRIEGSLDPKTYNVDTGLCLQELIAHQV
jgi:HD-GYP domain-containing protein (c-di-GMP phosphodiesterase class II)